MSKKGNSSPKHELQLRFLKRLERLLNKGYPLITSLEMIQWDKQLDTISSCIINELKSGVPFDEALEKVCFHPTITSYLYFVRVNGDLIDSIGKCIAMFEQRALYIKKFQEITRYPMILFVIFTILLYFVNQSVLPSFLDLFHGNTRHSSTITISIMILDITGISALIIGILLLCGFMVFQWKKRTISIEKQIKFYSFVPVYFYYKRLNTSLLFATHLSTLLKTGLSIKEILNLMAQYKKQPILSYFASQMTEQLSKGIYINHLLATFPLLDKQIALLFQKNTDMDDLQKDLAVYADLLNEELHRKIIKLTAYIQPVFFTLLAGFIIFIYISLMWPMFQLIKSI